MVHIIGISGGSGSGKSFLTFHLANELSKQFGKSSIVCIGEDHYYRHQPNLDFKQRSLQNYDHPNAFDHSLLLEHLFALSEGRTVEMPQYDYCEHLRSNKTETIASAKFIILEGIHLFTNEAVRNQLSFKIFVNTSPDLCLIRRIQRDTHERGRTVDSVLSQYMATVRPMFDKFIKNNKVYSDIVVNGEEPFKALLQQIKSCEKYSKITQEMDEK